MNNGDSEKIKKNRYLNSSREKDSYSVSDFYENSHSPTQQSSEENQQDDQIAKIVQKVMKKSRRAQNVEVNYFRSLQTAKINQREEKNIYAVNSRIEEQNMKLKKEIEKLGKKVKLLETKQSRQVSKNSNPSYKNDKDHESQLNKLKKRIERAALVNSKMENQLHELQKSRRTLISKKKKSKISDKECPNCKNQQQLSKNEKSLNQNVKSHQNTLFSSPIAQFYDYKVPVQATTFRINSIVSNPSANFIKVIPLKISQSVQANSGYQSLVQEQSTLDLQIKNMENQIIQDNLKIENYEGQLLRGIVRKK